MKAEKDPKTGKWLIQYRYTDWQGKRRKSTKRGFATKREAEEWLRKFLMGQSVDFDMPFRDFVKIYCDDLATRLREHTMRSKRYIIEQKLLPYFGEKRMNDIKASDVRTWQNTLIKQGYAPTYLKNININSTPFLTSQYDITTCSVIPVPRLEAWAKIRPMKCSFGQKRSSTSLLKLSWTSGCRISPLCCFTGQGCGWESFWP